MTPTTITTVSVDVVKEISPAPLPKRAGLVTSLSMTYPTQDDILRVLATLQAPHSDASIVEEGMISVLSAKERQGGLHVQVVLEIDPQDAKDMERVRAEAEKRILSVEGVSGATVILSAHKEAPSSKVSACSHAGGKQTKMPERQLPDGVKHVIAIASGKGGVGKSTTAVNLSLALAAQGLSVGLLDADVYGPSIPRMLGPIDEINQNEQGKLIPLDAHGIAAMSIGYLVPEDAPMIWRGPMVHGALKQMLYDVAWGQRDVLVLDMPPGTGDAALSVAQQVPLTGAVIVSTPQDISLLDVRKGISMFQKVGVPILGLIENMSYFECPHCKGRTEIFGHGGAERDAERLGIRFLGKIPLDLALRETSDAGTPIVQAHAQSTQAAYYHDIAAQLIDGFHGHDAVKLA